jgi:hypothetical protein
MKPIRKQTNSRMGKIDSGTEGMKPASGVRQNRSLSSEKTVLNSKQLRQREFLKAYSGNGFNVSAACRDIGANRKIFYYWLKNDPDFVEDLEVAKGEQRDYLKSKLLQLVDDGNLIATIFACKALGGMIEANQQHITIDNNPSGLTKEQRDRSFELAMQGHAAKKKFAHLFPNQDDSS